MSLHLDPDAARARSGALAGARRGMWQGVDHANVMSLELLSAILTWTAIGWLLDRALGTTPWLLASGALLGNAAGLYLVWLRSGRMDAQEREQQARREAQLRPGPDRALSGEVQGGR